MIGEDAEGEPRGADDPGAAESEGIAIVDGMDSSSEIWPECRTSVVGCTDLPKPMTLPRILLRTLGGRLRVMGTGAVLMNGGSREVVGGVRLGNMDPR